MTSNETTKPSNSSQAKISEFVSVSRSDPRKIIDGSWMLREAIIEQTELAARNLTIALQCAEIGDDAGLVYQLRQSAARMRFVGEVAGDLLTAKEALRAAKARH